MFNFVEMANDYESRKVGRYQDGPIMVSTAMVNDSKDPYETAIAHPRYNDCKIIIVETYKSRDSAEIGHERWVNAITTGPLPEKLIDVSSAFSAIICDSLHSDKDWRIFPLQPE